MCTNNKKVYIMSTCITMQCLVIVNIELQGKVEGKYLHENGPKGFVLLTILYTDWG